MRERFLSSDDLASIELLARPNPFRRIADAVAWRQLLRSCRLDPDLLGRPVPEPTPSDFVICGIPRSGTSFLAALLTQPPRVAVCMEPWDGLRLPPAALFASLRAEIDGTRHLGRGRLDLAALAERQLRWHRDGERRYPLEMASDYQLGVKWPGFWRYLDLLPQTRFLVCVRHPAAVLDSFEKTGGRLAAGLEYNVAFHRRMNHELERLTGSVTLRRAALYEYIASRIVPHLGRSQVLLVKYERWFQEPTQLLDEIADFLGIEPALELVVDIDEKHSVHSRNDETIDRACPSAASLGYQS